jgi:GNAT superfamily N-acetyltransferase
VRGRLPLVRPVSEVRQPQRVVGQARRLDTPTKDGGCIDIRELTPADVDRVDAVLPLSRLEKAQTYLVAWEADEPIGQAHIAWTDTKLGLPEVQDVFVRPEFRRRGVATELARAAERLAGERAYELISLSYGEVNEAARRLYESLGYTRADIAPEHLQETIWIRGQPLEVDETMIYLVKRLGVDSGRSRSS